VKKKAVMTGEAPTFAVALLLALVGKTTPLSTQNDATPEVYRARASMAPGILFRHSRGFHEAVGLTDKLSKLVFCSRWLMLSPKSKVALRGFLSQHHPQGTRKTSSCNSPILQQT
jgi:hypothetical protein